MNLDKLVGDFVGIFGQVTGNNSKKGDRLSELYHFLKKVPQEDRKNLQKIIGADFGTSRKSLRDQFIFLREGAIGQIHSHPSYKQLVTDVAARPKIDWKYLCREKKFKHLKTSEIEDAIVVKVFSDFYNKLPEYKQTKLLDKLNEITQEKDLNAQLITAGGLTLAKLSGFQIYLY